ncbi:hypothetical protein [Flexivirga oryzae]|uniref:Uncharacterized protein n=1 Tax=Flexivirga oryzae TaxID=1794944 RepID=A0A839N114_9MICO|nr:hypothetical protein [Flexivirga oryzae]MBB2891398.1 hypothetical protein [Flexivirga oryzae]
MTLTLADAGALVDRFAGPLLADGSLGADDRVASVCSLGWYDAPTAASLGRQIRGSLRSETLAHSLDAALGRPDSRPIALRTQLDAWSLVLDPWFNQPRLRFHPRHTRGGGRALVIDWRVDREVLLFAASDGRLRWLVSLPVQLGDELPRPLAGYEPDEFHALATQLGWRPGTDARAFAVALASRWTGADLTADTFGGRHRRVSFRDLDSPPTSRIERARGLGLTPLGGDLNAINRTMWLSLAVGSEIPDPDDLRLVSRSAAQVALAMADAALRDELRDTVDAMNQTGGEPSQEVRRHLLARADRLAAAPGGAVRAAIVRTVAAGQLDDAFGSATEAVQACPVVSGAAAPADLSPGEADALELLREAVRDAHEFGYGQRDRREDVF